MKKVLILIAVSLLLFGLVSAKGITSRTTDSSEDNNEKVCCKIEAVVPEPVPSYELLEKDECADLEGVYGASRKIVDDSYCKDNKLNNEDEIKNITQSKNKIKVSAVECPKNCTCTGSVTKCWLANGTREMTIRAGKSGNIIVQVKGINMSTNVTLYKSENGKLYGVFKGNKTKEVKMLPDQVQERIRERLARQLEDEEIELDEDGEYKYEAKERAKLFALFSVKLRVTAEVNAETGKIIGLRKAWWAIFTKEEGSIIVGASCGTVTPGTNDECCKNKGYDVWNAEKAECEFEEE